MKRLIPAVVFLAWGWLSYFVGYRVATDKAQNCAPSQCKIGQIYVCSGASQWRQE